MAANLAVDYINRIIRGAPRLASSAEEVGALAERARVSAELLTDVPPPEEWQKHDLVADLSDKTPGAMVLEIERLVRRVRELLDDSEAARRVAAELVEIEIALAAG